MRVGRLLASSTATGFPPKSQCRGSGADRGNDGCEPHVRLSHFLGGKKEAPLALSSLCPTRAPAPPRPARPALTLKPSTASSSGSTLWPRCSRERSHTTQMGIWSSSQYSFRGSRCFSHTPISPPGPDGRSVRNCFTSWVTLARCRLGRMCRCGKVSRHCGHDTLVSAAPQQRARQAQQMLWPQSSIMGSTKYCRHTGQVVSCCKHSATLPEAMARARGGERAWAPVLSPARSPTRLRSLLSAVSGRCGKASRADGGRRLPGRSQTRPRAGTAGWPGLSLSRCARRREYGDTAAPPSPATMRRDSKIAADRTPGARRSKRAGQRGLAGADPSGRAGPTPARAEGAARGRGLGRTSCVRLEIPASGLDGFFLWEPGRPRRQRGGGTRGRKLLGYGVLEAGGVRGVRRGQYNPCLPAPGAPAEPWALDLDPGSFVGFPLWCPGLCRGERKLALCWCGKKRHLASPVGQRAGSSRLSPTQPVRNFIKQPH